VGGIDYVADVMNNIDRKATNILKGVIWFDAKRAGSQPGRIL
jgi:hypothetical protein